jgi:hypothetical protein
VEKPLAGALVSLCAEGIKKISPKSFELTEENFNPRGDLNVPRAIAKGPLTDLPFRRTDWSSWDVWCWHKADNDRCEPMPASSGRRRVCSEMAGRT